MLKLGIAVLALAVSASAAHAISRYDTPRLSCERIQSILKSEGTVILRYPSPRGAGTLYDTYVANGSRCTSGGYGRLATVPAVDTKSCKVFQCNKRLGAGGGR